MIQPLKFTPRPKLSTYLDHLESVDGWRSYLATTATARGVTLDGLLIEFATLDRLTAEGKIRTDALFDFPQRYFDSDHTYQNRDKSGRSRPRTIVDLDDGHLDPEESQQYIDALVATVLKRLEDYRSGAYAARKSAAEMTRAAWRADWDAMWARVEAGESLNDILNGHSRSKDAVRKRRARAEGRVKPRPKRPATLEQQIAATEKSLATRREKLAALKTKSVIGNAAEIMRTEIGIGRTEKTLATYRARLAGGTPGGRNPL